MEKNELMGKLFPPETLDMIRKLKLLFDPGDRLNPGKVLPTGRGCLRSASPPYRDDAAAVWPSRKAGYSALIALIDSFSSRSAARKCSSAFAPCPRMS